MSRDQLHIPLQALSELCVRHRIARMSLFGSAARGELRPDSDVDILVEFLPGAEPSLLDLGGILMELRAMLGREVDLKTPGFLSPLFRKQVMDEARVLYAA